MGVVAEVRRGKNCKRYDRHGRMFVRGLKLCYLWNLIEHDGNFCNYLGVVTTHDR